MSEQQLSIQMVHLMRNAPSLQVLDFQFQRIPVDVLSAYDNAARTPDVEIVSRHAQASLLPDLLSGPRLYDGIDHGDLAAVILVGGAIHNEQALADSNLSRSQANTRRRIHRLEHIID